MSDTQSLTPIQRLAEVAVTLPTSAAIAAMCARSGKTVRDAVRAGRLRGADGKSAGLPPVYVSREGTNALTDAHKRAIVFTFVASDDDAAAILKRHGITVDVDA